MNCIMYIYIVLEREVKNMAQMGRPKADNPKDKQVSFRVDEKTYNQIKDYCNSNNIKMSDFFEKLLNLFFRK